ncbi:MAG: hypothetical protein ACI4DS_04520 [Eubacterium sp.]
MKKITNRECKIILIAASIILVTIILVVCIKSCVGNIDGTATDNSSNKDATNEDISNNNNNENTGDSTQYTGVTDEKLSEYATVNPDIEVSDDLVVPGMDTLDISKIRGFTQKADNIKSSVENIKIEAAGSYTGSYIEDGSDEAIIGVAAIIVTNYAERMIQYAQIVFDTGDGHEAVFVLTNLPSNTSALVMESSKLQFYDNADYTNAQITVTYVEQSMCEDKVTLESENGKISVTNITDKNIANVYVYYKYYQIGGIYLGGITYRATSESIEAGETVDIQCVHYNKDTSLIVSVTYVE